MKVYTFSIGMLPIWSFKEMKKIADELKTMDGFIGVHPFVHPKTGQATILVFDSYNNAIGGRNILKYHGNYVGENIIEAKLSDDKQTLTIGEIVERS